MNDAEIADMKAKLAQPHRVRSARVLHAACRNAVEYIAALEAQLNPSAEPAEPVKPRRGRPPKKTIIVPQV